ncbi:TRAP transporter small permease subunit [Acuticoccus sediminis]|nr:TRAP transporter small permease subunit [Acuticoccus sediminis]
MRSLLIIAEVLAVPCRIVARIIGWLLLVLMAVIIYDVIGRRFFSTGSFKLQELEWHIHGAIAVLGFGYAYVHNAHVRIDVFSNSFSTATKMRIEILAIIVFLIPFMALIFWFGLDFVMRSYERGEGSPGGVGLSDRWIIKTAIPAAAVLAIMGGVSVLMRAIVALRRPDLLADPWVDRS